jgi:hypothetical protein
MWRTKRHILLFLFICLSQFAATQQTPAKTDSSKTLYRDIEKFSKKRESTSFIYRIFFKHADVPPTKKSKKKKKLQKTYRGFEGKIIRGIYITTLDPFGYSVNDTTIAKQNIIYRAGNAMHIKTQHITIQNLILMHRNEPFDSLLVRESERLIRSQNYVHEVFFNVVPAGIKSDSVDIFIREWDIWSILPNASISTSGFKIEAMDKNFLGLGHEFQNYFKRNMTNKTNVFNTNYYIPNIRNTYINTTLHYGTDGNKNLNKSWAVDRPFFSPFARWAAGASVASQFKTDSLLFTNSVYVPFNSKFNTMDYWAGMALHIYKGRTEKDRTTNLILTGRYLRIRYLERPLELYDPLHIHSSEYFYLAGIGISARQYIQDRYIFNYGVTEDVPVGKVYGLTCGYQVRNNAARLYLGARFSFGNYNDWGYLSSDFEYGTFFRASHAEQGVLTAGLTYFTGLFEIGRWKFRQFVKPQLTLGINRFPSESITINNENGIRGFNSVALLGTKKMVLTFQTQSYSPFNLLGFRFGPYLIWSLGMLGDAASGFSKSRVYSQFSLGVIIKNEFLIFNVFQVSLAFYPVIPDEGKNVFKMNSNSTGDFGFRDFIIGKPAIVAFQ